MRKLIYKLIDKNDGSRLSTIFDYVIMTLIVLSVVSIILESIESIKVSYGGYLKAFNIFSITIFSIEYLLRIIASGKTHPANNKFKSALKFIFSTYGIIDLLAILPFFLPMLIKLDLRFLRALRLTRILRILKLNRYNSSMNLIWLVIKEKRPELTVTGFISFLILLISSFLMYYIEGKEQPEAFPNILASFWWAVATLTTVGYGDVYPVTAMGRVLAGLIAILGIGIIALPTGIISSGFLTKVERLKSSNKCPHCGGELE
ncbi:ion transporter [Carboxylicivirga sp. RSCT41]|uniref:ion transporter n=1 Tax=Carboxylicivirga agarovorans TaxID=3417570 RepID=UPI003D34F279